MDSERPKTSRRRNLDCMTKKELQQMAKERVTPIPSLWKLNKQDLVAAMRVKSSKPKSSKPKPSKPKSS